VSARKLEIVDSDGDRLTVEPALIGGCLFVHLKHSGVYLSPADARRLADPLPNWRGGVGPAPSDPPRPAAATGEGGVAGRGPSLDGTFTAGAVVHLTVEATVDEHDCYVIRDAAGNVWGQCPSLMSFIVGVQAAPVDLPKKFGAVVRATLDGRRNLFVLADPGSSDGRAWVTATYMWASSAELTDVEVLHEGIDTDADAAQ